MDNFFEIIEFWNTTFTINIVFSILLGNFDQKNQNCLFEMKFSTQTNSNSLNSEMTFTFLISDQKYPIWADLIQKINTDCFI